MQTETPIADTADSLDALRTVAVNASYDASRALSKWFKRGVRLTSDGFESVPLTELSGAAGQPDEPVAAIHLHITGDITGDILLAFPERVALQLVDILIGAPPGTSTAFTELEQSCLQETGNIVGSAFANSLASWLNLAVTPQSPNFIHDVAAAVIEPLIIEHASESDEALMAKTEFELDNEAVDWRFILIPSAESMETIKARCDTDELRRHALQTIAINGAFGASRAMSKWLRRGVRISTDGFVRATLRDACPSQESDQPIVALHAALNDQLHGHTLMLMGTETAAEMVHLLTGVDPGDSGFERNDLSESCLRETCNIISSAFVNSWSKWLDIHVEPGPPQLIIDHCASIIEAAIVEQATVSDDVLMAKAEFSVGGKSLEWQFMLLPSPSSLRLIENACQ